MAGLSEVPVWGWGVGLVSDMALVKHCKIEIVFVRPIRSLSYDRCEFGKVVELTRGVQRRVANVCRQEENTTRYIPY